MTTPAPLRCTYVSPCVCQQKARPFYGKRSYSVVYGVTVFPRPRKSSVWGRCFIKVCPIRKQAFRSQSNFTHILSHLILTFALWSRCYYSLRENLSLKRDRAWALGVVHTEGKEPKGKLSRPEEVRQQARHQWQELPEIEAEEGLGDAREDCKRV